MKKELLAGITLTALVVGAVANILHLKGLVAEIDAQLSVASHACSIENYDFAEQEFRNALQLWLDADDYTHIFIRHSEIDSATDAFYEALTAIVSEDQASASSAVEKLRYHLHSILTMEYVTIRSVF